MTNLDNIRQMNSEELAKLLLISDCKCCKYNIIECDNGKEHYCFDGIKAWLEQEVTPTLTDDEKVILRNIDKNYRRIYRDTDGTLCIETGEFHDCPVELIIYNHLFNFIEPTYKTYEISKLLGE